MTLLGVVLRNFRGRRVPVLLTILSVALIVATLGLTRGIRRGFLEGTTDYSLVIGAKGSPTQLVLNVIFRMDTPTPNISLATFRHLADDARVDVAVPIAMGDAYQGFRYVATSAAYFAAHPWRRATFHLADGRFPQEDSPERPVFEALVGADAARATGLRVGDRFHEGEEMADFPLTVVGVPERTGRPDDRTIFLSLPSYWAMNEVARKLQVKPLTALLLRAHRMSDLPALHREYNVSKETQAVFPSAVLLDIFNLLQLVEEALTIILIVVAAVAFLYLFVTMYAATLARVREIATMRALGARRATDLSFFLLSRVSALGNYCCEMPTGQDETVYVSTARGVSITYDPLRVYLVRGTFEAGKHVDPTYGVSMYRVRNAKVDVAAGAKMFPTGDAPKR